MYTYKSITHCFFFFFFEILSDLNQAVPNHLANESQTVVEGWAWLGLVFPRPGDIRKSTLFGFSFIKGNKVFYF